MMSLPLALGTTLDNIPAPSKYLKADVFKVVEWQQRLGIKNKPRIGIVWSSDPTLAVGPSKTIALELFASLQSEQFELVSLQKNLWYQEEDRISAMGVRHFGETIKDFVDTAVLIECMDLVISVDTSVAHLAGALGKPVWILLHSHADWRWLLNRSDSVWYPSAKLYRKPDGGNWQDVMSALKPDLHQFTQSS
jgi:ADP-heptose:LPS heptosyltransferase